MPDLELLVPEAAASVDSIQFKLVLGGTGVNEYLTQHDSIQPTAFRSFQQLAWLHDQLSKLSAVFIPALPETPKLDDMDDQDYVERKRLQVARYFAKLVQRPDLAHNEMFVHFLSNDMSPSQVARANKGVLSFLRFNRTSKPTRAKFHSYKVMEPVDGDENELFHRHQIYILMLESYFGSIAESLERVMQVREGLADTLTDLGDMIIETTQSKYQLGEGIAHKDLQRALDRKMQLFGMLMDELGFLITRQGKEETMQYGDVLLEYKDSMDGLKTVFNTRTQKLMDYVESAKHRSRKRDRADRLKLRMGMNANEVQTAVEEEQQATDTMNEQKQQFDACQTRVKEEMRLFEGQKARDLLASMKAFARVQLRYEQAKLDALDKTLTDMQHLKPMARRASFSYGVGGGAGTRASFSRDASGGASSDHTNDLVSGDDGVFHPSSSEDHTKKRRPKHHYYQSPPQKTLQSSASLPTWTRPVDADANDTDALGDPLTGTTPMTTTSVPLIASRTVPLSSSPTTIAHSTSAAPSATDRHWRQGLSSSYDDRLLKSQLPWS